MNRYFILGPVIIALAFTLHYRWETALQVLAGVVYFSLGFTRRPKGKSENL